jgi:hypothetical protein
MNDDDAHNFLLRVGTRSDLHLCCPLFLSAYLSPNEKSNTDIHDDEDDEDLVVKKTLQSISISPIRPNNIRGMNPCIRELIDTK